MSSIEPLYGSGQELGAVGGMVWGVMEGLKEGVDGGGVEPVFEGFGGIGVDEALVTLVEFVDAELEAGDFVEEEPAADGFVG